MVKEHEEQVVELMEESVLLEEKLTKLSELPLMQDDLDSDNSNEHTLTQVYEMVKQAEDYKW